MRIFSLLLFFSILFLYVAYSAEISFETAEDQLNFTAGYSIGLDAVISEGIIISPHNKNKKIKREIRNQLKYSVGFFNEIGSVPDFTRIKTRIISLGKIQDEPPLFQAKYHTRMFMAWNKDMSIPNSINVVLPARGDKEGRQIFFDRYAETCRKDRFPTPMSLLNFWYRFRINKWNCPLSQVTPDEINIVQRTPVYFEISDKNTEGKYPEYHEIWKDNKFIGTFVFGKSKEDGVDNYDQGIRAYNNFYKRLIKTYGRPIHSNVFFDGDPGIEFPYVNIVFRLSGQRDMEIHMFLVSSVKNASQDFYSQFAQVSENSDVVSYNGHAGLGGSIRVFAKMGTVLPKKYQLYVINGCTSFAYFNDDLSDRFSMVNPGVASTKYLDIISNVMPSRFNSNADTNLQIIKAIIMKNDTYKQILRSIDKYQRAVVTGEEDNRWPFPFI